MTVCLPAWLVGLLVLLVGMRGVVRDLVEHDGLSGLLRGSGSSPVSRSQDGEK